MAELGDFTSAEGQSNIIDFMPIGQSVSISNSPSNRNFAANTAVLETTGDIERTFRTVSSELEDSSVSQVGQQIVDNIRAKDMRLARESLFNLLSDPATDIADKESVINTFLDAQEQMFSTRNIVSTQAAMADSEGETKEAEKVRVDTAGIINKVNEYKRYKQQVINREIARTDSSLYDNIANFTEIMLPFMESAQLAEVVDDFKKGDKTASTIGKSLTLMGQQKAEIRDALKMMPPEEQRKAVDELVTILNNHKGIVLTDDNDFIRTDFLRSFIEDGYYEDTDQFVDNAVSLLDSTILGGIVSRSIIKGMRGARAGEEAIRVDPMDPRGKNFFDLGRDVTIKTRKGETIDGQAVDVTEDNVGKDIVVGAADPTSVAENYKDVNPDKARKVHHAADADTDGEFTSAAYGTSRTDAMVNDVSPQPSSADDTVKNKVGQIDRDVVAPMTPDADVMDFVTNTGAHHYWKTEKVKARSRVVNDFQNALGLTPRTEMFDVKDVPDGVTIGAVYGPTEGGFGSLDEAKRLTEFALRDYGITEDNITILRRDGDRYVPVDKDGGGGGDDGDFLVRVDHDYKFRPSDVFEEADVKRNFLDFIPGTIFEKVGSIQRHLLDAQSMLHPNITAGASVPTEKAAQLEKVLADVGKRFGKKYAKLSRGRRTVIDQFIKDANREGIEYTKTAMRAAGLNNEEISMLNNWREMWDTMYWLENRDLAKTLRNRGYGVFTDKANNTELFAKPLANNKVPEGIKYYDQTDGTVKSLSRDQKRSLYDNGGKVAELRSEFKVGDEAVKYVISTEKADSSYIRALNESDKVLHYRPGYYQVHYKDPLFVAKKVKDSRGNVLFERAVASSGTARDARTMRDRLNAVAEEGEEYYVRPDRKKGFNYGDKEWFDMTTSAGRTAQRVRGERLEDATSNIDNVQKANIEDPVDALTRSIRNIARRVSFRDYLDTTKQRFMQQYGDVLPTKEGRTVPFDSLSRGDIKAEDIELSRKAKDARTTFEYIRFMENGYVNAIDDAYKWGLSELARISGDMEFTKAERALRGVEDIAPTQLGKKAAFKMYLALNPLRQWVVQSHQAVRLAAIHPKYVGNPGGMASDLSIIAAGMRGIPIPKEVLKMSGKSLEEANKMVKDFERSGMVAAVDANNLVRQDLRKIAETTFAGKARQAVAYPIDWAQKAGFDFGEGINITTAWLTFRDEAARAGRIMDAETLDEVAGKARAFTYGMNQANDMPYNSNFLNIPFQFLQVPHKALTQWTNRAIPRNQRIRAGIFDIIMWGVPGGLGAGIYNQIMQGTDVEEEDPFVRDAFTNGVESAVLNATIRAITGDNTSIDFSSIAPSNIDGVQDLVTRIWTEGFDEMIAKTPAGQLLFGNNPRITNAFKTAAKYFNLTDDYQDPTTFMNVVKSFAEVSSGYSNFMKAKYALEAGKKLNRMDTDVTTAEAIAQLFGFQTMAEAQSWAVSDESYQDMKAFKDDFKLFFEDYSRKLRQDSLTPDDIDYHIKVMTEAYRVWGNENLEAQKLLKRELGRAVQSGDDAMYRNLERHMGLGNYEFTEELIRNSNLNDRRRQNLLDTLEAARELRNEE